MTVQPQDAPAVDFDILTNPPYKLAKEFVLKALELVKTGRKVYMFLKLTFIEGKARYFEIFKNNRPKRILIFSERISCFKNGNKKDFEKGAVAFAWYVWEKGYQGETIVDWIPPEQSSNVLENQISMFDL